MITIDRLKEKLSYDPETGIFTWAGKKRGRVKLGSIAGWDDCGYLSISLDKKRYKAHRLAWFYYYGRWPIHEIDHIDCNRLNNKISNLRDIPHKNNKENINRSYKNKKFGLPLGVTFSSIRSKNKYKAQIQVNKKQIYLGSLPTQEKAHEAYVNAKRVLHKGCTI